MSPRPNAHQEAPEGLQLDAISRTPPAGVQPPVARGLGRADAARYLGIGTTLFDECVADGRMPKPKRIGSRVIWDRVALDRAFDAIAGGDEHEESGW